MMFSFDCWVQTTHPEILKEYSRHPKAEEAVVLWYHSNDRSDTEEKHV